MYRGTTPTITIEVDVDLTGASYVVMTLEDFSKNEVSVDNRSGMLEITPTSVSGKFTQAQTLSLGKGSAKAQIRAIDAAGNAIASNVVSLRIEDILKDGEIP